MFTVFGGRENGCWLLRLGEGWDFECWDLGSYKLPSFRDYRGHVKILSFNPSCF
jgi:hypothetical protein